MFETKNVDTRYASPDITHVNAITFDLTFDSFSNTAIDMIHESTSAISAIIVM